MEIFFDYTTTSKWIWKAKAQAKLRVKGFSIKAFGICWIQTCGYNNYARVNNKHLAFNTFNLLGYTLKWISLTFTSFIIFALNNCSMTDVLSSHQGGFLECLGYREALHHAWVVQRMDNAIHPINHYPVGRVVCFVNTYLHLHLIKSVNA